MFNGLKIKELLEEKGIQQNTFSIETGISKSNLWVWGEGTTKPGADALEKIADYFKVPIDFFFDREVEVSAISIGHKIKGNGNKVSGDITLSECQRELDHLRELLKEKEGRIKDKDEMIAFLKQQLNK